MNKFFTTFLAVTASGATMIALAALVVSPLRAEAYAVGGPVAPSAQSNDLSGAVSTYDFGSSFQNLVSPFTNFFNSMQSSGGVISIGGGNAAPGVTVNVNTQPYVNQFDSWFYGFTGVHVEAFINVVIHFFEWLFVVLNGIIVWIANSLKGVIH
jgi:hypothetical protein